MKSRPPFLLPVSLLTIIILSFLITGTANAQTYTILHSFTGPDGASPFAGLLRDGAGNLYGTTTYGGIGTCRDSVGIGCGTIFNLDAQGNYNVLHRFTSGEDGAKPGGGPLIRDQAGNLYGTTIAGGVHGCGTVYQFNLQTRTETVLYPFAGGTDGCGPYGGLVQDAAGNLYGTTQYGGDLYSGEGTIYKLDPSGTETILYTFNSYPVYDPGYPDGTLTLDSDGNLYGTETGSTYGGGSGAMFKVDASGTFTVLHNFQGGQGYDGSLPHGALLRDPAGNFYGTTQQGGDYNWYGDGSIYEFDTTGHITLLGKFHYNQPNGIWPMAGVIADSGGNFYGTARAGGDSTCLQGCGTVFRLLPNGKLHLMHTFVGTDGASPYASLIRDPGGNFYGTTSAGGAHDLGVIFKLSIQ